MSQRFNHDHRQHREDDNHDHETGHQRDDARGVAHLFFDQFAQRAPITARRDKQHHKILYRASQHHTRQQPKHAWQVPHLRGKHRPDERPRTRNRSKMVTEQHFLVGRNIVQPVVMAHGWRHTSGING
ncbi:hypothetical protein D3C75_903990 [compost metagenome]